MTRRLLAGLLLLAGVLLWTGVAVPARRARDEARAEFARLREERERSRSEAAAAERLASAGRTPEAGAAAARALRLALLRATEGLGVGRVAIAASSAEQGAVAATARLSAEGPLEDVLRVSDRLSDPRSGLLLRSVTLSEAGEDRRSVRLDVDAVSLRAGS